MKFSITHKVSFSDQQLFKKSCFYTLHREINMCHETISKKFNLYLKRKAKCNIHYFAQRVALSSP